MNGSPKLKPNCGYVIAPDRELVIDGNEAGTRSFTQRWDQRLFFSSIA